MSVYKRKTSRGETESYHYKFMIQGKYYTGVCKNCLTKADAQKFERGLKADIKGMISKGEDIKIIAREYIQEKTGSNTISLENAFPEYLKQPSKRKSSEKHTKAKESCWNDFKAFMKDKYEDIEFMDEIKTNHISEYLGYIQENGRYLKKVEYTTEKNSIEYEIESKEISSRTYNNTFGILKDIFKKLSNKAGIFIDPFSGLQKMKNEQLSREIFTEKELKLIAEKADDFIYPMFAIGLNTAFREGDICTLKWNDINFEAGFIKRETGKTGSQVLIPLLPSLKNYLISLKEKTGDNEYVLPEHAEMYQTNTSGISYRVKKFLNSIGIQTSKKVKGRSRETSVKDIHSLRHTFCYQAGLKKIPLLVVKDICGHMTSEMTELYQKHATMDAKREQLRLLESSMHFLPSVDNESGSRQKLVELVKILPIDKVEELLESCK